MEANKNKSLEDLKSQLVSEVGEQLAKSNKNIHLLDVLNRLLGTVSNALLNDKLSK